MLVMNMNKRQRVANDFVKWVAFLHLDAKKNGIRSRFLPPKVDRFSDYNQDLNDVYKLVMRNKKIRFMGRGWVENQVEIAINRLEGRI